MRRQGSSCNRETSARHGHHFHLQDLEILLSPDEAEVWIRVHIALDVQVGTQPLWPTEEDTTLARPMDLTDATKHHVPVWTAEICRRPETCNGVGIPGVEDDVGSLS